MTKEEILNKISEHGGTWAAGNDIVFSKSPSDDEDEKESGFLVTVDHIRFWSMSHHTDITESILYGNGHLRDVPKYISAYAKLCKWFGIDDQLDSVIKIMWEVGVSNTEPITIGAASAMSESEARALGKAEAYEKLLVGREITIGK